MEIETTECIMGEQLWLAKCLYMSSEYPSVPLLPQPHPELPDYRRPGFGAAETNCSFCFVSSQIHFKSIACFIFRSWLLEQCISLFWLLEVSNCLSTAHWKIRHMLSAHQGLLSFLSYYWAVPLQFPDLQSSLSFTVSYILCIPLSWILFLFCWSLPNKSNQIKYCLYIPESEHRQ